VAKKTTIKQIDAKGEIQDLNLWFDPVIPKDGTWKFSGDIKEDNTAENVRIYSPDTEKRETDFYIHPVWGKCLKYDNDRFFSFRYENPELEFSKSSYFKYWHQVCCHLEFNTNAVISRKPRPRIVQEIDDFVQICSCARSTAYKFVNECLERSYLAKFETGGKIMFIASPEHTRKGYGLPIMLWQLFRFGREYLDNKGVIREEKLNAAETKDTDGDAVEVIRDVRGL